MAITVHRAVVPYRPTNGPRNQSRNGHRVARPTRPTRLLNLSGGIDSAYTAYKLLTAGQRLLLHHCKLDTRRQKLEYDAVQRLLAWFRTQGLHGFEYIETQFSFGTMGQPIWDVELIGFLAGTALRDPRRRDITTVVIAANAEDYTMIDPRNIRVVNRRQLAETVVGRPLTWETPIGHMTKADVIKAMPDALFYRTWWCRKPMQQMPCRRCHTCKQVHRARTAQGLPVIRPRQRTVPRRQPAGARTS